MKKPFKHFTGYYYTTLAGKVPTIAERPGKPMWVTLLNECLLDVKSIKEIMSLPIPNNTDIYWFKILIENINESDVAVLILFVFTCCQYQLIIQEDILLCQCLINTSGIFKVLKIPPLVYPEPTVLIFSLMIQKQWWVKVLDLSTNQF